MILNQWSRNSGVLVAALFAVGAFLAGSTSSQETRRGAEPGEIGRYQMIAAHANDLKIIDTKTGRYWQRLFSENNKERWDERAGPLGGDK